MLTSAVPSSRTPPTARRQRGAVVIEMAFAFSILFALFWGIISYALPLFMQQVMNHATSETARYVIRLDPGVLTQAEITVLASTDLQRRLDVLPPSFRRPEALQQDVRWVAGSPCASLHLELAHPGCSTDNTSSCLTPAIRLLGTSIPNIGRIEAHAEVMLGAGCG